MHLLIAAAGSGTRMGADCNKLLLNVAGRPILAWTLNSAIHASSISWIGIIGNPVDKHSIMKLVKKSLKPCLWINGGRTRQESVQLGLAGLPAEAKHVLIHDGARCLAEPSLFNNCSEIVESGQAVIAAAPVTDTIKKVDVDGFITETPDRSVLWSAQTPQGFSVEQLKQAHRKAIENEWSVTDDASLYERLGWPVRILETGSSNLKVTTKVDLHMAEALISLREEQ